MIIQYSPQIPSVFSPIEYSFSGDIVTVTFKGICDTFDFSGLEDGELARDENGVLSIETDLEIQPIVNGYKNLGVLHLELLKYISKNASYAERFPEPFDTEAYHG